MGPEFNDLFNRYFRDKPDKVRRHNSVGFDLVLTPISLSCSARSFLEVWYPQRMPYKYSSPLPAYADHTLLPPGKYFTMFQYLEYPASRGKVRSDSRRFR